MNSAAYKLPFSNGIPVRFGVIGCSSIVPRALLESARYVGDAEVVAVVNRTAAKAEKMAERYGIGTVHRTPEELLSDSQVDAVYIALSNDLHAQWIIKALNAGKHVLVEKPLCLHTDELEGIESALDLRQDGLCLLEGVMVRHHPWQDRLHVMVADRRFGRLRTVETRLCIPAKNGHADNYRSRPEQGGGCFRDLGVYWLQFLQTIVGLKGASFHGQSSFAGPGGCDWTFEAQAEYLDGLSASALFSFERPYRCSHTLTFDHAVVTLNDCFRANLGFYKMTLRIQHPGQPPAKTEFRPMNYYVNQLDYFCRTVRGMAAPVPFQESAERIRLLESIYKSAARG
ncbi:Gfo/Idh/MocA family oxidoreductase [Paenibacillus sp. P96]|uniref:Gfo/Idh/MocA family oxidoreductase n=1 Tax=Paenibacillus zeirhizosphaerae TaxID=2987519 RepID=A0ABT9FME5_9BACL|nr:Gfo/Idh/MocA family oxidoreductase [Paenibacillus sp. P96]MDP4095711.1 Gfo/Idh/MocA family oxidoreductase [Paenibacillus sp. P96]